MESSPEEFIQGVGNEVFYFFLVVSCLLVVVGAWFSTQVVEPVVSSLILVERTRINNTGVGVDEDHEGIDEYLQYPPVNPREYPPANLREPPRLFLHPANDIQRRSMSDIQLNSSESGQDETEPSHGHEEGVNRHHSQTEETSDPQTGADSESTDPCTESPDPVPLEERVTVRLKFLNETQRDVEASLRENIGNFKRRHFTVEMSENKNVRLIFNGQVLREETNTLESYGIFDKCVVHCLIHQQAAQANPQTSHGAAQIQEADDDFDVSELFIPIVGVGLIIMWYFAFTYSTYFNTMSSTALLALTSLFLFSVYGTNFHVNVAVRAR